MENKKRAAPPLKAQPNKLPSQPQPVKESELSLKGNVAKRKAPPVRKPVKVDTLTLQYAVSKDDSPTSPILSNKTHPFRRFVKLWQPGEKWHKSQDGGYMKGGVRTLPKVKVTAKNNNGYIVPAVRVENDRAIPRSNTAIASQQHVALDCDKMPAGTLSLVQRYLAKSGWWHVTYTTASHLSEAKGGLECFRIVVLTDKALTDTYDILMVRVSFADMLCRAVDVLEVDTASFALSQPMFLPPFESTVHIAGENAVPVSTLRHHFRQHELSVHAVSDRPEAVVPDYTQALFRPLAELLVSMGASVGRDGRMLMQASDDHALEYSSPAKFDDFAFMLPHTGIADVFNVAMVHETDLSAVDDIRASTTKRADESAASHQRRVRLAIISYVIGAVCQDVNEVNRLTVVLRNTLEKHTELFEQQKLATKADLSFDDEDSGTVKQLPAVIISEAVESLEHVAALGEDALAQHATMAELRVTGASKQGLVVNWLQSSALCGMELAYDTFTHSAVYRPEHTEGWLRVNDEVCDRLWVQCCDYDADGTISRNDFRAMLSMVAHHNVVDSAIEWASQLQWDGVPRVTRFFVDMMGVAESPYSLAVGEAFWTGAAGRLVQPGIKHDLALILVSPQGFEKTSTIDAMAPVPGSAGSIKLSWNGDKRTRTMRGKLMIELPEMDGFKGSALEDVKDFISARSDELTPKYKEFEVQYPRRCVFIGTTNVKNILHDDTGERRWLPLEVKKTASADIRRLAPQLWAEAIHMFRDGGIRWQAATRLAEAVHSEFKEVDAWEELLADELNGGTHTQLTTEGIAVNLLGIRPADYNRGHQNRIGRVMRRLGYMQGPRPHGKPRVWLNNEATPEKLPFE